MYSISQGMMLAAGVANVISYETGVLQNADVQAGDNVLQWMAVNFDLSVLDFWCPVAMGCAVVVAPAEDMKDVERVAALVQQHSIVSISIVPSMCQVRCFWWCWLCSDTCVQADFSAQHTLCQTSAPGMHLECRRCWRCAASAAC